jgi:predicted ABC-type ATPase
MTSPQAPATMVDKFEYQQPTDEQTERIKALRQSFRDLEMQIENLIPVSQERSLATTNLRQAMFWANAAVVFNGPRPEPQP